MWITRELLMGYKKRRKECVKPRAGDADLWMRIGEELHIFSKEAFLVEVERVKAHRSKKLKENMSKFEKFVTEGNEEADDLVKAGAMSDEGFTVL